MTAKNTSHSRAFFLELVINLVLFSLCAAICLQVFAQAFVRSGESGALAQASLLAQSAAETFKSADGDPQRTAALLGAEITDGGLTLYYDGEWAPAENAEDAVFRLSCAFTSSGPLHTARIAAFKGEDEIYAISAKKYRRETLGQALAQTLGSEFAQSAAADADAEYGIGGEDA
jgi:hypothetical protein